MFTDYVMFLTGFIVAGLCLTLVIGIVSQLDN